MVTPNQPSAPPLCVGRWTCLSVAALCMLALWPEGWLHVGLHGDEAWAGLRANALAHGAAWHLFGMNTHAGPWHQMLVACLFFVVGPKVWALRAVGVVANGLALGGYVGMLGQHVGRPLALWTAALVLSLPAIVTFGAVGIEYFALSPLLTVAAMAMWRRGMQPGHGMRYAALSGALFGLGTWNHLAFIAVVIGAAGAVVVGSVRPVRRKLVAAGLGFMGVELYPLLAIGSRIKVRGGTQGVWFRLKLWPSAVWDSAWGPGTAMQTVGTAPKQPIWLVAVLACVLLMACLGVCYSLYRSRTLPHFLSPVLTALALYGLTTVVVVPGLGLRFVWLALWVLPLAIVLAVAPLGPILTHGACASLLLVQGYMFVHDVAVPLHQGAQVGNVYTPFGTQETSNHYVDAAPVYEALVALGAHDVISQNFIGWPLAFLDLPYGHLKVGYMDDTQAFAPRAIAKHGAYYVMYAQGLRNLRPEHIPQARRVLTLPHYLISQEP